MFSLQMLHSLFLSVMSEECRSQWSMSRPLFLLILLNEAHFARLTSDLLLSYPPDKRPGLQAAFSLLMEGVDRSLTAKNRDRFVLPYDAVLCVRLGKWGGGGGRGLNSWSPNFGSRTCVPMYYAQLPRAFYVCLISCVAAVVCCCG